MSSLTVRTTSTDWPAGSLAPVAVGDSRIVGTGVAAAHGDHDVAGLDLLDTEDPRSLNSGNGADSAAAGVARR